MNESRLIKKWQETLKQGADVIVGIGDDAAVLKPSQKRQTLVTTDTLMEGVHFFKGTCWRLVGRKALAVNLSDIAAMGGVPQFAVVSLCLPRHHGAFIAEELYQGLQLMAEKYDVSLCGGDTNSWDGPLVIGVTVIGHSHKRGPILRSGARPGDAIWVSGPLGNSLTRHHLHFEPRLKLAKNLLDEFPINAMMDISDGLSIDLSRVCDQSSVRAVVVADQIPLRQGLEGDSGLNQALHDGEDFELLITASQEVSTQLAQLFAGDGMVCIGQCHEGEGVFLQQKNALTAIKPIGYLHCLG